ncbi:MAG TPA: BLUF domain-containing protein [Steroidobacteraceae bacterium]|nr:BLUF domain-containing protein [Steroidobacteraceae bacterium]
MLVRCLYASRAAKPLSAAVLDSILEQSARNNPRLGVTGVLCYAEEVFVQVLEGGRDEVCELFNAIVRDERHLQVRLLVYQEIGERRYGNWTMGQVNAGDISPALLLKYSEKAELNPFNASGPATLALLDELMATGAIVSRGR